MGILNRILVLAFALAALGGCNRNYGGDGEPLAGALDDGPSPMGPAVLTCFGEDASTHVLLVASKSEAQVIVTSKEKSGRERLRSAYIKRDEHKETFVESVPAGLFEVRGANRVGGEQPFLFNFNHNGVQVIDLPVTCHLPDKKD